MTAMLALFNHLLAQHPSVRAGLAQLAGRRVALELPPVTIAGVVTGDGWLAATSGEPECRVRVSPAAALALQFAGRAPAFADLAFAGDTELAQRFAGLTGRLRWLPVEDLSRLVGDVAAARLETAARRTLAGGRDSAARLADSLAEYWRDEVALVARRQEVEAFVAAVDGLRDDAERLEKRLVRLESCGPGRLHPNGTGPVSEK